MLMSAYNYNISLNTIAPNICLSGQQLDKINIRDVPLLSASVTVVNTARVTLAPSLTVKIVAGRARCFRLQEQLLPTKAASSSRTVTVC